MKQFPTHIVAVFGVVENDRHEILLLKHRDKGLWMFPGGQVEAGENLIDALLRETREESNMDVAVGRLFCVASNTCSHPGYNGYETVPTKVMFGFTCAYMGGEFKESDETTEACWEHRDSVLKLLTDPPYTEYKAYLNFNGDVKYLEYVTRPEFKLKVEVMI